MTYSQLTTWMLIAYSYKQNTHIYNYPECRDARKVVRHQKRKPTMRGWRNTAGNLIECLRLKTNYHGLRFTGICVKHTPIYRYGFIMYVYIYIYVWLCIHMCISLSLSLYIYIYINTYTICVCICIYIYIHTHIRVYVYIYIYRERERKIEISSGAIATVFRQALILSVYNISYTWFSVLSTYIA